MLGGPRPVRLVMIVVRRLRRFLILKHFRELDHFVPLGSLGAVSCGLEGLVRVLDAKEAPLVRRTLQVWVGELPEGVSLAARCTP